MDLNWKDLFWIMCIIVANLLFFLRKGILAQQGYGISFFDLEFQDSKRLLEIIKRETLTSRRVFYQTVNLGIKVSLLLGVIWFVIVRIVKVGG